MDKILAEVLEAMHLFPHLLHICNALIQPCDTGTRLAVGIYVFRQLLANQVKESKRVDKSKKL